MTDFPAKYVAEQITLADHTLLKSIGEEEFYNGAWAKDDKQITSPHLVKFIAFSNQYTYWMMSEVLKVKSISERARRLEYFLHIGEEMLKINNFNGASMVILALRHPSIHRLKDTWSLVSSKMMEIHRKLVDYFLLALDDPEDNYDLYRRQINEVEPPFVPFMRIMLEEIADSCTDPAAHTISTRHYKCSIKNMRIQGVQQDLLHPTMESGQMVMLENLNILKKAVAVDYGYEKQDLVKVIQNYKVISNETAYQVSLQLEPRHRQNNDSSNLWIWVGFGGAVVIGAVTLLYLSKYKTHS